MTLPAYTGILTPAHRQLITAIGEQGMATVLSVAPVDRAAADGAVRRLYDAHKLPRPSLTVWMDSPLGCIYAAGVVGQFREQLRWQLLNQLRQQLIAQMGGGLWAKFTGQIREQLGDRLGDRLRGTSSGTSLAAGSRSSSGASSATRVGMSRRARAGMSTCTRSFPGTTPTRWPSTIAPCLSPADRRTLVSGP